MDLIVPADYRVEMKSNKKLEKYLHLSGELKKLWYRKMTVKPIIIGVLRRISKN